MVETMYNLRELHSMDKPDLVALVWDLQAKAYDDPEEELDTNEAAAYTGMSTSYLEKLRHQGEGPRFIRRGKKVYYKRAALKEFKASITQEYHSTSEYAGNH